MFVDHPRLARLCGARKTSRKTRNSHFSNKEKTTEAKSEDSANILMYHRRVLCEGMVNVLLMQRSEYLYDRNTKVSSNSDLIGQWQVNELH